MIIEKKWIDLIQLYFTNEIIFFVVDNVYSYYYIKQIFVIKLHGLRTASKNKSRVVFSNDILVNSSRGRQKKRV